MYIYLALPVACWLALKEKKRKGSENNEKAKLVEGISREERNEPKDQTCS